MKIDNQLKHRNFKVETIKGEFPLSYVTLFIERTLDIEDLEFWEDRLERLEVNYAVVTEKLKDHIYYSVFVDNNKKARSLFK